MSERKASDILLDLENKIELLIKRIDNQDLLLKAQHNKVNELIRILTKLSESSDKKVSSSVKIVNPDAPKKIQNIEAVKQPAIPVQPELKSKESIEEFKDYGNEKFKITQRVIDMSGKALYLVAIQIINLADNSSVARPTTKGNGKFSVDLPAGKYRFKYSKQIDLNSARMEKIQDIIVTESKVLEDIILS